MATGMFNEDNQSEAESRRTTLLDAIDDRNRRLNKKSILHRMVVISSLLHDNYNELISHYEQIFKDIQSRLQCESATGLLLLYPYHCVHVLEGPIEILLELCRDLRREKEAVGSDVQPHMDSTKILVVSHDIPVRLYQSWTSRVLDIEAPNMELYEPSENNEKIVIDILIQLLNLGMYINKNQKQTSLDIANENVAVLLPQQPAVNYLLKNDIPCIFTPQQYLRKYEVPFDVSMSGDMVWPLPVRLFPYNN